MHATSCAAHDADRSDARRGRLGRRRDEGHQGRQDEDRNHRDAGHRDRHRDEGHQGRRDHPDEAHQDHRREGRVACQGEHPVHRGADHRGRRDHPDEARNHPGVRRQGRQGVHRRAAEESDDHSPTWGEEAEESGDHQRVASALAEHSGAVRSEVAAHAEQESPAVAVLPASAVRSR